MVALAGSLLMACSGYFIAAPPLSLFAAGVQSGRLEQCGQAGISEANAIEAPAFPPCMGPGQEGGHFSPACQEALMACSSGQRLLFCV